MLRISLYINRILLCKKNLFYINTEIIKYKRNFAADKKLSIYKKNNNNTNFRLLLKDMLL